MPYPELKAILTDIGVEELGHLEIVGTIVHQLTRSLTESQYEQSPFANYFVDHTAGVYPVSAAGNPFTAAYIGVKGDVIADLTEDMAAEQKARVTYDNILRLSDDPDVNNVIRFLREREIVHFQRFGEALRIATDRMDQKNVYAINPAFDRPMSNMMNSNVNPMNAERSNVSPMATDKSNISPMTMEKTDKSNISPMTMEKTDKSGLSPMTMDKMDKSGLSPMTMEKTEKSNISPMTMDKMDKSGLSPMTMDKKEKSNLSPATMDKAGLSPMTMDKPGISPSTGNKSNISPMITENNTAANPMPNRMNRQFERSWMDK